MSEFWNERFSKTEYVYGKEPNEFLKQEIENLNPGKILFLGEGEGRNAVYAAKLGWDVDAFDQSEQGKRKAEFLAAEKKVKINYQIADLQNQELPENTYDAVAIIYFHLHENARATIYKKASHSLKHDGRIILELFDKEQVNYTSGGPSEEEVLYSLEGAVSDFIDLDFVKLSKEIIELNESPVHQGKAAVIRFVGRKSSE